ncbi:uncharacterized protein LOC129551807 [Moschus berezovskii]|uniref:uncharacterized protein LOC129551807 n=1 Tax=Moschus berezovskii TaxID=68408 RepID=UPI002443AF52|nr:uncharacterized protein LOC129551807 [Moschus berezovskii]
MVTAAWSVTLAQPTDPQQLLGEAVSRDHVGSQGDPKALRPCNLLFHPTLLGPSWHVAPEKGWMRACGCRGDSLTTHHSLWGQLLVLSSGHRSEAQDPLATQRQALRHSPSWSKGWLSIYPEPEVATGALEAVNLTGQWCPGACGLQGCCGGGTRALPRCGLHGDACRCFSACGPWTASLESGLTHWLEQTCGKVQRPTLQQTHRQSRRRVSGTPPASSGQAEGGVDVEALALGACVLPQCLASGDAGTHSQQRHKTTHPGLPAPWPQSPLDGGAGRGNPSSTGRTQLAGGRLLPTRGCSFPGTHAVIPQCGAGPPDSPAPRPSYSLAKAALGWSSPGEAQGGGARATAGHQEPIWSARCHPAFLTPEHSLELRPAPSTPSSSQTLPSSRGEARFSHPKMALHATVSQ